MQSVETALHVSIAIVELYLHASAPFEIVPLHFNVGEIVLPNFPFCMFVVSIYANILWRLKRYTSVSDYTQIAYAILVWTIGHFTLKSIWTLLISCSAFVIRKFCTKIIRMDHTVATEPRIQLCLSYASLAIAVATVSLLFAEETVDKGTSQPQRRRTPSARTRVTTSYRVPK